MPSKVCARDLRHSVALQSEIKVSDSGGGHETSWSTYTTVRAKIEPLKGAEQLRGMQLESKVTHRMTIRYRSGVSNNHRALYDGRAFNIRAAIDPDERKRWLVLSVEEGTAV